MCACCTALWHCQVFDEDTGYSLHSAQFHRLLCQVAYFPKFLVLMRTDSASCDQRLCVTTDPHSGKRVVPAWTQEAESVAEIAAEFDKQMRDEVCVACTLFCFVFAVSVVRKPSDSHGTHRCACVFNLVCCVGGFCALDIRRRTDAWRSCKCPAWN